MCYTEVLCVQYLVEIGVVEVLQLVQPLMKLRLKFLFLFSSCVTQIAFDPIFDQLEELSLLVIHAKHHLSWLCVAGLGVG